MATQMPIAQSFSPEMANDSKMSGLQQRLTRLSGSTDLSADEKQRMRAELKEAAQGFEAMLVNELMKEMMPEENGLFGKGLGGNTYHQLFITELSSLMAESGQLGLAEQIERDVAVQAGLTDESENRTEPIPGVNPGRPLPQIRRLTTYEQHMVNSSDNPGMMSSLIRNQEGIMPTFTMPVQGRLSSEFGERKDPFTGDKRHHHGIDIAASEGSDIAAAADGVVTFSGWKPGYGRTVIVEHSGGYESRYAHNADNLVRKGETVRTGQTLAKVGSSGRSTGPHVHFEIRKDGLACDPHELVACED